MILVSGFNVYPNEIEDVVCSILAYRKSRLLAYLPAPVGSGENLRSEKRSIAYRRVTGTFCRRQLTGYKVPKLVEFRESYRNLTSEKFCDENYVTKRGQSGQ